MLGLVAVVPVSTVVAVNTVVAVSRRLVVVVVVAAVMHKNPLQKDHTPFADG